MRILHCYKVFPPDVTGGIPEVIGTLAKGMSPRHQSCILVARSRGPAKHYVFDGVEVEAVSSFGTVFSTPISPHFPFALAEKARMADLVAFHHPFPLNDVAALFAIPRRSALVVHWHAEIVRQRMLSAWLAPMIRRTLARAQRIVISHPSLLHNSRLLTSHAQKCAVIPFGIDAGYWSHLDRAQQRRMAALRSRYPRLVIAVGRLVPYKGFRVLIEAMRHVQGMVIIVGDGPLRDDLVRMTHRFGIADRVIFSGALSRDDLKIHLHAARICALPSVSHEEAFGIAQVEAMAAGLPIVNTALPTGVPHVARHGLEALTVRPNDADSLAAAIGKLLADEDLARALGTAGRTRAKTEYGLDQFISRARELYENVLAENRDRRPTGFAEQPR